MGASAKLGVPFAEQIEFFRNKKNLPSERWDDIWKSAHDRGFIVTGAGKAELLSDFHGTILEYMETGKGLDEFRRDFRKIVERHGWHGWKGEGTKKGEMWRTRVIFETNMRTSYMAGKYKQLTHPNLLKVAPYWQYVHSGKEHYRPQHKAWGDAKLTLRHDHPFWQTHFPPNGWFCGCSVSPVGKPARDAATEPPDGWDAIDARTGAPVGIDKGWDYAPGASAETPLLDIVDQKLIKLDGVIGAAMWEALEPAIETDLTTKWRNFFRDAITRKNRWKSRGKWMIVGALAPRWIERAIAEGVPPATAEIAIRDRDIFHIIRDEKVNPLNLLWLRGLTGHLKTPQAVILDKTQKEPALLLIYASGGKGKKLIVRINYQIRKVGVKNLVDSGRELDDRAILSIRNQIGKGYVLIEGSV